MGWRNKDLEMVELAARDVPETPGPVVSKLLLTGIPSLLGESTSFPGSHQLFHLKFGVG